MKEQLEKQIRDLKMIVDFTNWRENSSAAKWKIEAVIEELRKELEKYE